MEGSQFDRITRLVDSRWSRRAGAALLAGAILGGRTISARAKGNKGKRKGKSKGKRKPFAICRDGRTIKIRARNWKSRYPEASKGRCSGECDGCSADRCFASAVRPADRTPLGFACCPADKVCRSNDPVNFPDQCCYPDETCRPELANIPGFTTICCRPCNGACCPNQNDECIEGVCTPVNTARLPRARRP